MTVIVCFVRRQLHVIQAMWLLESHGFLFGWLVRLVGLLDVSLGGV